MTIRNTLLLENATATNSAPTTAIQGIKWSGLDEALLLLKNRAGSGTMTATLKLWGMVAQHNNALGIITCDSRTNTTNNTTIIMSGGPSPRTFELDTTSGGVTAGRIQVDISAAADTAAGSAAVLATAINGQVGQDFQVRAVQSSGTVLVYRTDLLGSAGNQTFSGTAEGINAWAFTDPADGYDFVWCPLGTDATDATKGIINAGNATGETGTDSIAHVETVSGLKNFARMYLEVTAIGGTATSMDAFLIPR